MKVLLVDDSPPARDPIEKSLIIEGYDVTVADDGRQALEKFRSGDYDLIITDLRMPEMDGLELLRRVRAARPDYDVIIITGHGDMDSSLEALRLGACNYLMKPVQLEEVSLAVRKVAEKQDMTRRLREQEQRLIQARKMADLGLVAAGISHEINNPNTFIRGNVQTLIKFWNVISGYVEKARVEGVDTPDRLDFIVKETPAMLHALLEGSDRIKKIVENMAACTSNHRAAGPATTDLNTCVVRALEEGAEDFAADIALDLASDIPPVTGTEDEITEVAVELIRNSVCAVQSRPEPRVEVRTEFVRPDRAILAVSDNGKGIKKEDQSKIYTPFFSTDHRIGRPGLGLSKVFVLVKSFGGDTFFTSEEGTGSKFTVQLAHKRGR